MCQNLSHRSAGRVNQRWLIYQSDGFHNDILLQSPNHGLVQLPKGIDHVTNLYQRRVRFAGIFRLSRRDAVSKTDATTLSYAIEALYTQMWRKNEKDVL